jgi:hypothetical protein
MGCWREENRRDVPIPIACTANWDSMTREGRRRFCTDCKKYVHDLSSMSEAEASEMLRKTAGEGLCIAYLRDEAGNILFNDHEWVIWRSELSRERLIPASRLKKRHEQRSQQRPWPLQRRHCR